MSEKYFKKVTENGEEKTVEVTLYGAFESEDEFNRNNQSYASKGKNEILKELGVESVATAKEKFSAVEKVTELEGKVTELTAENAKYLTENTELLGKVTAATESIIVQKHKVPDEFRNEFLTLARAGVKEKTDKEEAVSLEQSAELVAKKLSFNGPNRIVIGGTKQPGADFGAEALAKMRLAAGLKD